MTTIFDNEMMKALAADGEYLLQVTGEDHGPYFLSGSDWYERRNELEPGMVCTLEYGPKVRLDHRVPGGGTNWSCDVWIERTDRSEGGYWSCEEHEIHPGDIASVEGL